MKPTPYEIIVVLMSDIVLRMEMNPRMTMGEHAKFWLAELDKAGYIITRKPKP
jgi:hypothetical protein